VLDAVETRRALAGRVVERIALRTALRATLLTGSVAHGTCGPGSDIDLLNYYESLPSREDFDLALSEAGATLKDDLSPPGAAEFLAAYDLDGIEVQTGAQLTSSLEAIVDRIATGEIDWATAKVAMGLQEGVALHGEDLIRNWRERITYPDELRRREVQHNLGFFPIWKLDSYLATREAELFRRQMLLDGAFRALAVLSALNGVYFSDFQFKRASAHAAKLAAKPHDLAARLALIADGPPAEAAEELRALIEETKALVSRELPNVDVEQPWLPPSGG